MVNGVNPAVVGNAARARIDSNDSSRGSVSSQSSFGSAASSIIEGFLSDASSSVGSQQAFKGVHWADSRSNGGNLTEIREVMTSFLQHAKAGGTKADMFQTRAERSNAEHEAGIEKRQSNRAEVQAPQAQANARSSLSLHAQFQSFDVSDAPPSRPTRSID